MDVNSLMQRLKRLATLDTTVFDEVKGDTNSTIPAIVVVAVATVLSGLGGWLWWVFADLPESGDVLLKSLIFGSILSIVLWGRLGRHHLRHAHAGVPCARGCQ